MKYLSAVDGKVFEIEIGENGETFVNGEKRRIDLRRIDNLDLYSVLADNTSYELFVEEEAGNYRIQLHGQLFTVDVKDAIGARLRRPVLPACPSGDVPLTAPIPGIVIGLNVAVGEAVDAGQVVAVLESMKMENELKSPCRGTVKAIEVELDQVVERGQTIAVIGASANG